MEVMIDLKILALFVIFAVSLVISEVFSKKFSAKMTKDTMFLLKFIKTMIDEDLKRKKEK